jgi:hypothetical protein
VPAVTHVAPIDVELDAVEHPSKMRGVRGLLLGGVPVLRRAVTPDVTGGGRRADRRLSAGSLLGHVSVCPERRAGDHYARGVDETAPAILERTQVAELEQGDHERFSHIVLEGFHVGVDDFLAAGNSVVEGMITSTPVVALCGKTWVPGKDPTRYPVCPSCKEIAASRGWRVPGA